jgi:ribosomal protein S18 acetylase RimI-like enzyme
VTVPPIPAGYFRQCGCHRRGAGRTPTRVLFLAIFLHRIEVGDRDRYWRDIIGDARQGRPSVGCRVRRVGFVAFGPAHDYGDPGMGEVYAVYVDPESWSRVIGTNLTAHAVRDLLSQGYTDTTLWVLAANRRARSFYQRGGWKPAGEARTEMIGGSDLEEVRYRLPLR